MDPDRSGCEEVVQSHHIASQPLLPLLSGVNIGKDGDELRENSLRKYFRTFYIDTGHKGLRCDV